jgi:cytochrome c-type biogenesis protein CcmH
MKRLAVVVLAASVAFAPLVPSAALAAGADESTYVAPLADPAQEARAKGLQKELRCLVCQGQSIDESNAPLATDLRRLIREQIASGMSDDQIKEFLVARYGVFVLMQPPVRSDTYFLWFVPIAVLLVGGLGIGAIIMRSRQRLAAEPHGDEVESQS